MLTGGSSQGEQTPGGAADASSSSSDSASASINSDVAQHPQPAIDEFGDQITSEGTTFSAGERTPAVANAASLKEPATPAWKTGGALDEEAVGIEDQSSLQEPLVAAKSASSGKGSKQQPAGSSELDAAAKPSTKRSTEDTAVEELDSFKAAQEDSATRSGDESVSSSTVKGSRTGSVDDDSTSDADPRKSANAAGKDVNAADDSSTGPLSSAADTVQKTVEDTGTKIKAAAESAAELAAAGAATVKNFTVGSAGSDTSASKAVHTSAAASDESSGADTDVPAGAPDGAAAKLNSKPADSKHNAGSVVLRMETPADSVTSAISMAFLLTWLCNMLQRPAAQIWMQQAIQLLRASLPASTQQCLGKQRSRTLQQMMHLPDPWLLQLLRQLVQPRGRQPAPMKRMPARRRAWRQAIRLRQALGKRVLRRQHP